MLKIRDKPFYMTILSSHKCGMQYTDEGCRLERHVDQIENLKQIIVNKLSNWSQFTLLATSQQHRRPLNQSTTYLGNMSDLCPVYAPFFSAMVSSLLSRLCVAKE